MNCNLLSLVMMSVHQNPLDQVVPILVASNIDERNTWAVGVCCGDDSEVALKELDTSDLQALLDNFGCKLIDAVIVRIV